MKTRLIVTSALAAILLLPALPPAAKARTLPTIELVETFDTPGADPQPTSINLRGEVAGYATFYNDTPYISSFVRRRSGASYIFAFEDNLTYVGGLNSSRTVCGYYFTNDGAAHGYFFSDGVFTDFQAPGGGDNILRAINDAGDVTGEYSVTFDEDTPFLTRDGTVIPIDLGFDAENIQSHGISSDGRVTGFYRPAASRLNFAGFIREADGSIISGLRDPDALHVTYPMGINARGWVVGSYYQADDNIASAFLYFGGRSYINYTYPGATQTFFTGINDRGRICGYYTDSDGNTHGMILQVVE